MSKRLRNDLVVNIEDHAFCIPDADGDGKPLWEIPPDGNKPGTRRERQARVADLLRQVVYSLPRVITFPNDEPRQPRVIRAVLDLEGDMIVLHDKDYAWVHSVLNRELPEHKDPNTGLLLKPLPYKQELWPLNSRIFVNMLKSEEERKTLKQLLEEDDA